MTAAPSLTTAETFQRAVSEGAAVINNSWGPGFSRYFPLSTVERTELRHARLNGRDGKGTVIVFAAGNETANVGSDAYARASDVITVAASTNLDDWAYYSNYGAQVDVAAPSVGGATAEDTYGIVTTDVTLDDGYDMNDYTGDFGGTSAASPITAGLAALVLSANPTLTADQVRLILTSTADKIVADQVDWPSVVGEDLLTLWAYDDKGHSDGFGYGRINAAAAVTAALTPTLQGGACDAAGCEHCDTLGRCQIPCSTQAQCPDGSSCDGALCETPVERPTDIGEPCDVSCAYCLDAFDSDLATASVCTSTCTTDEECPAGFDCRLMAADGTSLCAIGITTAGEPADFRKCFDDMQYARVEVAGDDGQPYCADICANEGQSSCPLSFHCGNASCTCKTSYQGYCMEWLCREGGLGGQDWEFPLCFPDAGFGVNCSDDHQCKLGDYCKDDGCRLDDRLGCAACAPCETDTECGPRGICRDLDDGGGARCYLPCGINDECPGNAQCQSVAFNSYHSYDVCISPVPGDAGELCHPRYSCTVLCRDDVPCADGLVCNEAGTCVVPPEPEHNSNDGSGCNAATTKPTLGALLLLLGWGFGRRVRRLRLTI